MNKVYFYLLFLAGFIIIGGCEAPHNNPVDPDNPNYGYYSITGVITSMSASNTPLSKVSVTWNTENITKLTDDNGNFVIYCEHNNNGWLLVKKEGYALDSVYIEWAGNKQFNVQKRLDELPVLNTISFYSTIKNKYSKAENLLTFDVNVSDADDDIDSVKIKCPTFGIEVGLEKKSSKAFTGTFSDIDLGLENFDDVIGKQFLVYAKATDSTVYLLGNSDIKRIIKSQIEVISPVNSDSVTNTITLNWKRFTPGFSFRYKIEVYTNETEPKLLWQKDNISSEDISLTLDTDITPTVDNDSFFWVIWCIDEFNNGTRSKPAGFIVKSLK